ncbi:hypothetical protein SAMN04488107_2202 [Geodermatophilus saharensis]|uniref:Histidine kinase n=1 Tax=Geodermatophilus saharensis TaxID=1137994 RepID=A0A239DIP6_9ACTN|nr:hypothetical protein [Geodermatophilus saharensis]SNS32310.1 hypothetical protein SAMN04488107_2202 [Geodermatophilus saharensis]
MLVGQDALADLDPLEVRDDHDALVREAALVHARARAAEHLVREDPAAAVRALRGLTRSSGAVYDALRAGVLPEPAGDDAGALAGPVALADLLGGFRASGGAVRFTATGPEGRLSPEGEAAVRSLLGEVLRSAGAAASLSVSLTWSATHLDLLVVLDPPRGGRAAPPAPVTAGDLARCREPVRRAGGSLRVEIPESGGSVVAAALPVAAPAVAGT